MKRYWIIGTLAMGFLATNFGCVGQEKYDQLNRAHRTLKETLSQTQQDLQDARAMLAQKDTKIDSLQGQLEAKSETIASLTAENENLRNALNKAQDIVEGMAKKPQTGVQIIKPALPPQLDSALKQFAENHPDLVEYDSEKGAVRWKADLLFPLGSDKLANTEDVQGALQKFAEIVQSDAATGFDVIVVGHTDTTPIVKPETLAEHPTNWHLSVHRSIAVMQMLSEDGVPEGHMGVMGYSKYRPISGDKAKNRRVEIYLVPKGAIQSVSQGVYKVEQRRLAFVRPSEIAGN